MHAAAVSGALTRAQPSSRVAQPNRPADGIPTSRPPRPLRRAPRTPALCSSPARPAPSRAPASPSCAQDERGERRHAPHAGAGDAAGRRLRGACRRARHRRRRGSGCRAPKAPLPPEPGRLQTNALVNVAARAGLSHAWRRSSRDACVRGQAAAVALGTRRALRALRALDLAARRRARADPWAGGRARRRRRRARWLRAHAQTCGAGWLTCRPPGSSASTARPTTSAWTGARSSRCTTRPRRPPSSCRPRSGGRLRGRAAGARAAPVSQRSPPRPAPGAARAPGRPQGGAPAPRDRPVPGRTCGSRGRRQRRSRSRRDHTT